MENKSTIHVVVVYPSAVKPFDDQTANPAETLASLKARILKDFGLSEGQTPEGSAVSYMLFHGKQLLDNLNQTLAELAGHAKSLQFKLAQQLTQGSNRDHG